MFFAYCIFFSQFPDFWDMHLETHPNIFLPALTKLSASLFIPIIMETLWTTQNNYWPKKLTHLAQHSVYLAKNCDLQCFWVSFRHFLTHSPCTSLLQIFNVIKQSNSNLKKLRVCGVPLNAVDHRLDHPLLLGEALAKGCVACPERGNLTLNFNVFFSILSK